MKLFELTGIRFAKKSSVILDDITITIEQGDRIGILGPSGSGKSSFFRILNMLASPSAGTILYQGKPLEGYTAEDIRRQVGYILQKPYLFGSTVKENLIYPYRLLQKKTDWDEVQEYLSRVNLASDILEKKNNELSGGEQQRVALVRSLLVKPQVILLDEVTASLDHDNTLLIENCIRAEQQAKALTLLFISHSEDQAARLAEKILYLVRGRVEFFGSMQDFFTWRGGRTDE